MSSQRKGEPLSRNPYLAHSCAQDPAAFEGGFTFAAFWVTHLAHPGEAQAITWAIATSSNRAWPDTARLAGLPPTPAGEGFALGVYGLTRT